MTSKAYTLGMKKIIDQTWQHWKKHRAPRMGAALSYYAMLSCIPLLILMISAASVLFKKDVVEIALMHQLIPILGTNASSYISELLHATPLKNVTIVGALISGLVFIIGALGMFSELEGDLNELLETPEKESVVRLPFFKQVNQIIRKKIIPLSLIPLLALLLIVAISVTTLLSLLQSKLSIILPGVHFLTLFQVIIPFVLSVALFALLYSIIPNRSIPRRAIMRGSIVTSILFVVGNIIITAYIALLIRIDIFGGASSLVGFLVWVYYSAQVFFFGASYTFVYATNTTTLSRD
jgi:membrane protein